MATDLNYNNTSPTATTSGALDNTQTNIPVDSTAGFPTPPFLLTIERKTANEEVCLCTAVPDGTNFTVTRGYDGTTAISHDTTVSVEHTTAAVSHQEPNDHINQTTGTPHGAAYQTTSAHAAVDHSTLPGVSKEMLIFSQPSTLATGVGKGHIPLLVVGQLVEWQATVNTVPTGSAITLRLRVSGTSVGTMNINAGAGTSTLTSLGNYAFSKSQLLRVDIDAVGSTEPGRDLVVAVSYIRTSTA